MTLSDSNPGFKVTGYLKVARVFNCTKHSCRSLGALPKTCQRLGVVADFLLKACFTPVKAIKPNRVSLR